ncbi:MAG: hypothetical protein JWP37_2481 [Mucilaginibacter sp.]|nr:hypothetical protein [Mucilaginibacter sp.]
MDTVDAAKVTGRSVDEPVLEGANTIGIFMYVDIRNMAAVDDVVFYSGFRIFDFGFSYID